MAGRMTLRDIAEALDVSASTVSRVINGYSRNFSVKPEIRRKIMELVESSGYQPNQVFKSIRTSKSRQIAFLCPDRSPLLMGQVTAEILDVIAEQLEENRFSFQYVFCPYAREDIYSLPQIKSAGYIIADAHSPRQFRELRENNAAYVSVNGIADSVGTAVMSDEVANMRIVMEYLHQLGHRRIGFFNYPLPQPVHLHYSLMEREQTYIRLCGEFGIPVIEGHELDLQPPMERVARLLNQNVTAVITYDHHRAEQLYYYAWEHGISIPGELSVVSFNMFSTLKYMTPPLTCLAIPAAEIGEEAVSILLRKVDEPDFAAGRTIRIPGKLVVHNSCAEVKQNEKSNK